MTRIFAKSSNPSQPIVDWPHRACVQNLISAMTEEGYKAKSIRSAIGTIGAFIEWKMDRGNGDPERLFYDDVDRFIAYRANANVLRFGERRCLRRLRTLLEEAGVLVRPPEPDDPMGNLIGQFAVELRRRGYVPRTVTAHVWFSRRFVQSLWNDATGLTKVTYDDVRSYLADHFDRQSTVTSKIMSSRLRLFLRYCWSVSLTECDLSQVIPVIRNLRFSSLPSFMTAEQLNRVLEACDRTNAAGRRDFAILLLLSRLGLRAKEVASLTIDDIDWREGLVRVTGKGGRIATMPLPHDVGTAISDYILHGRPLTASRTIFHRVETPCTPFSTATPVVLLAGRALRRAKITGLRSYHAHVFRHTFATMAIRSGVTLTELSQVLRHKEPDTTRIYAKLDTEALRSLSRPWLGAIR